jgi:hypothetical protein
MNDEERYFWLNDIFKHKCFVQDPCGENETKAAEIIDFFESVREKLIQDSLLIAFKNLHDEIVKHKKQHGLFW